MTVSDDDDDDDADAEMVDAQVQPNGIAKLLLHHAEWAGASLQCQLLLPLGAGRHACGNINRP